MIVFSPVAQQPSSGVEDGLQAIQETLRRADQRSTCDVTKAATAALAVSKGRDLFDAAFQETKLTEAASDGPSHVVFHR